MTLPPLVHDLPPEALRVLALATPFQTPYGGGSVAWHAWGEGPPLVMLHGGSGSWTHWLRNVEAVAAAGRRVLVPDLPGFGDSRGIADVHDADTMVAPLASGLTQVLGGRPCDLVGFSFGGMVAGLLASEHPGLVRRLVLVGAPGLGLRDKRLRLTPWKHLEDAAARDAAHRENLALLMLQHPESIDSLAIALHKANVTRDSMRRRSLGLTAILARQLETMQCPVDAIYGDHDIFYVDMLPRLREALQGFACMREVRFIPGGHWVQYENAPDFNRELLRLLAREDGPA